VNCDEECHHCCTRPGLASFAGYRTGQPWPARGFRRISPSRDFAAATSAKGLRSGLFSSLGIIEANPGISQSELSREVGLDKSVTVTIVDELEKFGWAVRERSKEDRRRHELFITEEGKAHLDELFTIVGKTEDAVLHQLSPAELHLLSELLDRMYAACMRDDG
jgi:DNA-binding MarR family transcriptional regulator